MGINISSENLVETSTDILAENSVKILAEDSADCLAENLNCLLDRYNARANLDFLIVVFAANFIPVKKSKNLVTSVENSVKLRKTP